MEKKASDVGRSWGKSGRSIAGRNFRSQLGWFFPSVLFLG